MAVLDRAYWFTVLLCAYTVVASLESAGFSWARMLVAIGVLAALFWVWRFAHLREKRVDSSVDPKALQALRAVAAASSVWLLSRFGQPQVAMLELIATLALSVASVSSVYALARIPSPRGLQSAPKASRSLDAAGFTAMIWGVALVVAANEFLAPESRRLDPLTLDYAVTAASIGSLFVLIAAAVRVRWQRRLELGVGDRVSGALAFLLTALLVAIPVAAVNIGPPDRVLPAALLAACVAVLGCVVAASPSAVSSALRVSIVLVGLGVPVALVTGSLVRAMPERAGLTALLGSIAAVLVGLIARSAARPLGPEQSRWLDALTHASSAALVPEPRQAILETLRALKGTSTSPEAKPKLFRADPASVLSVNVRGDLEERDAEAPKELYELGMREPERTLRAEVLRALAVRRPDVRPLLGWFETERAFSATVIVDDDGPLGFLLLPAGGRSDVMTLEEAHAACQLSERIAGLLGVTSALERARRRQLEARRDADRWEAEFYRARIVLQGEAVRHAEFARTLARPLTVSAYSPAARLLLSEIERAARTEDVVTFVVPVGVDVQAWVACLHLSREDGAGPLLVVDAALEHPRDASRWKHPESSPVALSLGGTLFIRDIDLLEPAAQMHLLEGIAQCWERRNEAHVAPPCLVMSVRKPPSVLASEGVLSLLQPLLSKTIFELPTLAERPEDLRSLILQIVSRSRSGPEQNPLGVDRRALEALLDHAWPGNEAELGDLLERAMAVAVGPTLTLTDLETIGFGHGAGGLPTWDDASAGQGLRRSPSQGAPRDADAAGRPMIDPSEHRPRPQRSRRRRRG